MAEPASPVLVHRLWQEYRERVEPVLESPPLVRGGELVERLGRGGPEVGEMLRRIELARIEGAVTTREEALALLGL